MNYKNERGITLVELIIIVALIAILGAIAVPNYTEYKRKAHRLDAKTALQHISAEQERYFTTNHSYASDLSQLGMDDNLSANGHYVISLQAVNTYEFQAVAVPAPDSPQVKDLECQQFSINSLSETAASPDPGGDCWQ